MASADRRKYTLPKTESIGVHGGGTELKAGIFAMDTQCHVDCECGAEIWLTVDRKDGMTEEEHDEACIDALLAAWNRRGEAPI